jgi:hypothetical protein
LPRRFPAATREAAPKNEAGKGKNEEFQLSLRIADEMKREYGTNRNNGIHRKNSDV